MEGSRNDWWMKESKGEYEREWEASVAGVKGCKM